MHPILRACVALLLIAGLFTGVIRIVFPEPCKQPIAYSVGDVDARFKISEEEFLKNIIRAEQLWEARAGYELFTYDPSSSFTINLTYDERQAATDHAKTVTQSLEKTSRTREGVLKQYEAARRSYEAARKTFEQHRAKLDADVASYTATVNSYNKEGGASADEYERLTQEQQRLASRFTQLEQERIKLNELASNVNALAQSESGIVSSYNETVRQFNSEFSEDREFDQGEYTGNAITIYEFSKPRDLVLVLTHELGHALGIGHVSDPRAVMYYMVNEQNLAAGELAPDDIAALTAQCSKGSFDVFWERLNASVFGSTLKTLFNS